jgi:hypothetical protein
MPGPLLMFDYILAERREIPLRLVPGELGRGLIWFSHYFFLQEPRLTA